MEKEPKNQKGNQPNPVTPFENSLVGNKTKASDKDEENTTHKDEANTMKQILISVLVALVGFVIYWNFLDCELVPAVKRKTVEWNGSIKKILVIGDDGVGKSSVINMISDEGITIPNTASELPLALSYEEFQTERYKFYEFAGLTQKRFGTCDMKQTISNLVEIVEFLEHGSGLHLMVFVMRIGRITDTFVKNYKLFVELLTRNEIPIILVLTDADGVDDPNEWLHNNIDSFRKYGLSFDDIVLVCASRGEDLLPEFAERVVKMYDESKDRLIQSVEKYIEKSAWVLKNGQEEMKFRYEAITWTYSNLDFVGNVLKIRIFMAWLLKWEIYKVAVEFFRNMMVDLVKYVS